MINYTLLKRPRAPLEAVLESCRLESISSPLLPLLFPDFSLLFPPLLSYPPRGELSQVPLLGDVLLVLGPGANMIFWY